MDLFFLPLSWFAQTEDFEPYFTGRKRLLPRPSDLSFYNWETQTATSNPTPNYQVNIFHYTIQKMGGILLETTFTIVLLDVGNCHEIVFLRTYISLLLPSVHFKGDAKSSRLQIDLLSFTQRKNEKYWAMPSWKSFHNETSLFKFLQHSERKRSFGIKIALNNSVIFLILHLGLLWQIQTLS